MDITPHRLIGLVITAVALQACAARQGGDGAQAGAEECVPVADATALGAGAAARLEGVFRLHMMGTSEGYADRSVSGTLELHAHDSSMYAMSLPGGIPVPDAFTPLYGTLDAAVEEVGGIRVGEAMSLDPTKPGVLVIEQSATSAAGKATTVTLRVGSEANRRDRVRFDGGFLALHVHEITLEGFAGSWVSGLRGADRVGYFCAFRVGEAAPSPEP